MQHLLPWAQSRFFYNNGSNAPLAGGKIYFYYAGTTNPAPTYQTEGGSQNPNPVILDINGEAQIWLSVDIVYDMAVTTDIGASVLTRENVSALTKGATGPQGPQGRQGTQGAVGAQGSQGNQGNQGAQGSQGAQGAQGSQGYQGHQGEIGSQGNQGNQGAQGGDTLWELYNNGPASYIFQPDSFPVQTGQNDAATIFMVRDTNDLLGRDSLAGEWHAGSSELFSINLDDTNNTATVKSFTGPVGSTHLINGATGTVQYVTGQGNNYPLNFYWTCVRFIGTGDLSINADIQVRRLLLTQNLNVVGAGTLYYESLENPSNFTITGNISQSAWDTTTPIQTVSDTWYTNLDITNNNLTSTPRNRYQSASITGYITNPQTIWYAKSPIVFGGMGLRIRANISVDGGESLIDVQFDGELSNAIQSGYGNVCEFANQFVQNRGFASAKMLFATDAANTEFYIGFQVAPGHIIQQIDNFYLESDVQLQFSNITAAITPVVATLSYEQLWDSAASGDFIRVDGTSTTTAAIPFAEGIEVLGVIPGQGGMALSIPDGRWIGPQGAQGAQSIYITNGANPGSTNSALHLTPSGASLQAGNGTQAESRLKLETGTADLAAIDNANVLDYLHLGDNNVILQSASANSLLTLTGNEADLLSSNQTKIGSAGAVIINAGAETQIHSPFTKSFNGSNQPTFELSDAGTIKATGPIEAYANAINAGDPDRLVIDYVSNLGVMGIRDVGSDSFHSYLSFTNNDVIIQDSIAAPGLGKFNIATPKVQISNLPIAPNIGDVLASSDLTGDLIWQAPGSGPQGAQGTNGIGYVATSTSTENIISSGSFFFTINPFLTAYVVGSRIRMAVDQNRWMEGTIYSYNQFTGAVGLLVDNSAGSGTFSNWNITIAGDRGVQGNQGSQGYQGVQGPQGAQGNQGASGAQAPLFTTTTNGLVQAAGSAVNYRFLQPNNTWDSQVDYIKQLKNIGVSGQAMIAPYASMLSNPNGQVVSGAAGYRELVGAAGSAVLFNTSNGVIPTTGMYASEIHNGDITSFAELAQIVTLNRPLALTGPVGANPLATVGLIYTTGANQNVQPLYVYWTRCSLLGTGTLTINAPIYVRTLKLVANLVVAGTGNLVYEKIELNGFTLTGNASQSYWDNTNSTAPAVNTNVVQLSNAGNLTNNSILFPPGGGANAGSTSWSAAMGYGVLSSTTSVVKFTVTIQKYVTNATGNITFRLASYPLNNSGQYLPGGGSIVGTPFVCNLANTSGAERWYSTFNFNVNFLLPTNVIIFLEVQSQNAQVITGASALISTSPAQV
jgi:hypothetical protein